MGDGREPGKQIMTLAYTMRTTCRVCGSTELEPLFALGEQYVSDFVDADKIHAGVQCPIELILCRSCTLVQQRYTAPQDFLYTRHYWYRSGVTTTMGDALCDVTAAVERLVDLNPGDVVLDIGSNDGTLLRSYMAPGIIRVGVEPATNLAEEGRKGIDLLVNDFWSVHHVTENSCVLNQGGELVSSFPGRAKIVTAIGMFYDLEDPNQFIADVAKVLAPDGVFVAQLMCLRQMLDQGDVGNLCHEHLEFYSLQALDRLLGRHGLAIFDLEENAVNGGSYRLYVHHQEAHAGRFPRATHALAAARLAEEKLGNPDAYVRFRSEAESNRRRCHAFISGAVRSGKKVWAFGASTKGNVLLQYYGLDCHLIEAAADRSPEKWGKYTVGTGIPIRSEEEFRKARPDFALMLPYSFRSEFLGREADWLSRGGKFIMPLPKFEVVGKDWRRDGGSRSDCNKLMGPPER